VSSGLLLLSASWLVKEHFGPWLSFHSEFLAFIGLAAMCAGRLRVWTANAAFPQILIAVLLIAGIPIVQFVTGVTYFFGDALMAVVYIVGFGFSIWLGFATVSGDQDDRTVAFLAYSVALPAFLSAAIGWFQFFNVEDNYLVLAIPSLAGLAVGNVAQPNLLATLLLTGVVAFTYVLRLRVISIGTFVLVLVFMSSAIAMTQSRAAIVGAFILALFLIGKKKHCLPKISTWFVGVWFIGLLCARWVVNWLRSLLMMSGENTAMSMTDPNGRWEIWGQVLGAISQAPWTGYGWNQTFRAQSVGALIHPGDITYTYAHNIVLDILAWNGVVLGALIVAVGIYWLISRMCTAKEPISIFAIGALLPVLVHSMFEFPFAYANFLLTAGLLIGVIEANHVVTRRFVIRAEIVASLSAVYLVVGAMAALEYVRVEGDYRTVRFENLRIGDTPSDYEVPHFQLLTHMGAMLDAARTAPAPGMSSAQIENLREASHRFPYGLLMYKYAVARALNGDQEGGIRQMQELKAIYGEKYYRQSKEAFHLATRLQVP
jgi:O-antigen ligase